MDLGPRGQRLHDAYEDQVDGERGLVLLEEAARTADRLDELDRVIAGKGVLNLMSFRLDLDLESESGDRNINVRVEFSHVLAEARQQAVTLRQLLVDLPLKEPDDGDDGEAWLDGLHPSLRNPA